MEDLVLKNLRLLAFGCETKDQKTFIILLGVELVFAHVQKRKSWNIIRKYTWK